MGVTFWVDWQEAKELSRARGDEGMIRICHVVFWLHIAAFAMVAYVVFSQQL